MSTINGGIEHLLHRSEMERFCCASGRIINAALRDGTSCCGSVRSFSAALRGSTFFQFAFKPSYLIVIIGGSSVSRRHTSFFRTYCPFADAVLIGSVPSLLCLR